MQILWNEMLEDESSQIHKECQCKWHRLSNHQKNYSNPLLLMSRGLWIHNRLKDMRLSWKAALLHTQAVSILGVEAGVIDEVDTTTYDIARSKRWAVRLSRSRGTEWMSIVSVVTIWMFIPTYRTKAFAIYSFSLLWKCAKLVCIYISQVNTVNYYAQLSAF